MPLMKSPTAVRIALAAALAAAASGCDGGFFVSGTVVDSEGHTIPGATLQATSAESSETFEATADERGCLSVGSTLAPGKYNFNVIVRARGYKDLHISVPTLEFHRFKMVLAKPAQAFVSQAQALNDKDFREACGGI